MKTKNGLRASPLRTAAIGMAAAALALSYSTAAMADAKAVAILTIDNFLIQESDGTDPIGSAAGLITVNSSDVVNDADVSATLNALNNQDSNTSSGDLDIARQCVGACGVGGAPASNDFSPLSGTSFPPSTATYASGDQVLTGNAVVGGVFAATRADVSLVNDGSGSTNSQTGTTAAFTITAMADVDVQFTLDYVLRLVAGIDDLTTPPGVANVNATAVWSLTVDGNDDSSDPTFSQGFRVGDSTPNEVNDILGLVNVNFTADVDEADSLISDVFSLKDGAKYTLFINHEVNANANFTSGTVSVSEPGSLAALGFGLILLGGMNNRRRKRVLAS